MRRVLVTGATAPLGHALVEHLLNHPKVDHVLAVGLESPQTRSRWRPSARLSYESVNLSKERAIRRLLFGPAKQQDIDTIVHMSLHRSIRGTGRRLRAQNVEALRTFLQLAEEHPTVQRLVFRSYGEIYRIRASEPNIIPEDHPLELSADAPTWLRHRVEADLTACTRMGMSKLAITVLRLAECLLPHGESQLYDYLQSPVCLRPMGYDPMINIISPDDAVHALTQAVLRTGDAKGVFGGIFNIPGHDTLPISALIRHFGRVDIRFPGPLLSPLYRARTSLRGFEFNYDLNRWRLHFNGVMDGQRAQGALGYVPAHSALG